MRQIDHSTEGGAPQVAEAERTAWVAELDGRSIPLALGDVSIGRSRGCGLPLADPSVSRVHAVLTWLGDQLQIQDLGSTNGTYLNGQRLADPSPLRDGDRVVVGETEIWLRLQDAAGVGASDSRVADLADRSSEPEVDSGSTAEMDIAPNPVSGR